MKEDSSKSEDIHDHSKRTQFCNHQSSCLLNILNSSGRTFYWSFIIKYLISKLFRSKEFRRSPISVLTTLNRDTVIFSLITTSIQATYKGLLCFIRKFSKENPDRWAAPIAGLIAGTWLNLDPVNSRRNMVMILILAKAIDCLLNILIRFFANFN